MSNGDVRTVSTDALETLGMIHTRYEKRDAIHLAVIPMECGTSWLKPGQEVCIYDGKAYEGNCGIHFEPGKPNPKPIGIVDPFLKDNVQHGQRFWVVLFPRQISSLRHVWSHPDIPDDIDNGATPEQRTQAEVYLRAFAERNNLDYFDLLDAAKNGYSIGPRDGGYPVDEGVSMNDEFWDAIEAVTGTRIKNEQRNYFYLTCCA